MWLFYAVALPITLGMVILTLQYFAAPKVVQHVRIIVAYAWFVNMSIVILVPVDVWTTICVEHQVSDPSLSCGSKWAIEIMWSIFYWSAFFLTWALIPILQGYEDAGDFTARERLKTSLRINLILIAIVGALALAAVVILLVTEEMAWDNIVSFAIGASNAFALITGALLLGFGLVEIPRGLWKHADLDERQRWLSHKVTRLANKLDIAHRELSTAIVITQATSLQMPRFDPLRPMMDIIDSMATEDPSFKASGGQIGENDMDYDADEKSLAGLRRRLRKAQENYARYKTEYCSVVWQALQLQETISNRDKGEAWEDRRFVSRLRPERSGRFASVIDMAEWWWRCLLWPLFVRSSSLVLALLSLSIVFAEATLLSQKWVDLSLPSVLTNAAGLRGELVQALVFIPLVYLCVCTYYSLFKLGMFSFYYLVREHTDSVSLLMNCSMVSRYAAPMCYNFLSLIHLTHYNHVKATLEPLQTVFEGSMGVLPDSFNRLYPLCMVLWCALIASNAHRRIVDAVTGGWKKLKFEEDEEEEDEEVEMDVEGAGEGAGGEGRRRPGVSAAGLVILKREKQSLERGLPLVDCVVPLARNFAHVEEEEEEDEEKGGQGHPAAPSTNGKSFSSSPSKTQLMSGDLKATVHSTNGSSKGGLMNSAAGSLLASQSQPVDAQIAARRHEMAAKYGRKEELRGGASPLEEPAPSAALVAARKKNSSGDLAPLSRDPPRQYDLSLRATSSGRTRAASLLGHSPPRPPSPTPAPPSPSRSPTLSPLITPSWGSMTLRLRDFTSSLGIGRRRSNPAVSELNEEGLSLPPPSPVSLDNIFEGLTAARRNKNSWREDEEDQSSQLLDRVQEGGGSSAVVGK